jgi:hypothetical protein
MEPNARQIAAARRLADAIVEVIEAACERHAVKPPPPARPTIEPALPAC